MGLAFNMNLYPPDGYVFTEPDGTTHRGDSWKTLKEKIVRYRAANKFPPGDPEEEITTQLCSRVPSFCRQNNPQPVRIGPTFNHLVIGWLTRILGSKQRSPLPRVEDAEAARRAAICARCPAQRSLNMTCGSCMNDVNRLRRAVLDGAESLHKNLQPCSITGEDCSVAVHIEQPPISGQAPDYCWRR
jgi:hypothetical protein